MSPKARPQPHLWRAHDPVLAFGSLGRGVPRIVHVHGLGARWQVFKPVMAGLQEHAQLATDLRGHGLSGRAAGDYSVEAMAGDLIDFLEAHCPEPVVLSGHSLGGWVAMAAASRRPELFDGLVVIDSPLHSRRPDPSITRSYLAEAPLALRAVSRSPEQLDPAVLEAYHDGEFAAPCPAEDLLVRFDGPVALLQADEDRGGLMSAADVQRAREAHPRLHHVAFEGIGHAVQVEDSPALIGQLRRFLEIVDEGRGSRPVAAVAPREPADDGSRTQDEGPGAQAPSAAPDKDRIEQR